MRLLFKQLLVDDSGNLITSFKIREDSRDKRESFINANILVKNRQKN